jgi:hypothetical protein
MMNTEACEAQTEQGHTSSFLGVFLDLIIGFLGLIINALNNQAFHNQTESWA